MAKDKKYGEVKTKKNFFPGDAKELVEKGNVGILITQCSVSDKTKNILSQGHVTLYEKVEPSEIDQLRETVKEKLKEKKEKEKGE